MVAPTIFLVKQVLSGDTFIAVNSAGIESVIGLSGIVAPRFSTNVSSTNEPFGFQSRDYLRRNLVGKKVRITAIPSKANSSLAGTLSVAASKVYAFVHTVGQDDNVGARVLAAGLARLKEEYQSNGVAAEEMNQLITAQAQAQQEKKGIWAVAEGSGVGPTPPRIISASGEFYSKNKGLVMNAIVEYVRDGSYLRLLVPVSPNDGVSVASISDTSAFDLASISIQLTGIVTPVIRVNVPGREDLVEPFAQDAKAFTESRLLQRQVKLVLDGSPSTSNSAYYYGSLLHPNGNISIELAKNGLCQIHDWSIALVSDKKIAEEIKAAEKEAKSAKIRLWKSFSGLAVSSAASSFRGKVVKVWSGDSISVVPITKTGNTRQAATRIFLSSIRQPAKPNVTGGANVVLESIYGFQAKEFIRTRCIGKIVKVCIDYDSKGETERTRTCATVFMNPDLAQNAACLNVALVSKGLATVVRHKKEDKDKSCQYEQLIQAEVKATAEGKGIFSQKASSNPEVMKINDASENGQKAKTIFSILQRKGRLSGIVDHVFSARKLAILLPKDGVRLNLLLSGIRVPGQGEPYATESYDFVFDHINQRNVSITVDSVDGKGNFAGFLFYNKFEGDLCGSENLLNSANHPDCLNAELLGEGLATIHKGGADTCNLASLLYEEEEKASSLRRNIWSLETAKDSQELDEDEDDYSDKAMASLMNSWNVNRVPNTPIWVTEIKSPTTLYFQIRNVELAEFERLMGTFDKTLNDKENKVPAATDVKQGSFVAAKFSVDGKWYRAVVLKILSATRALVRFVDYGNEQECQILDLLTVPPQFAKMSHQAKFGALVYLQENFNSMDTFDESDGIAFVAEWIEENPKLTAKIYESSITPHQIVIYGEKDKCLNKDVVEQGTAFVLRAKQRGLHKFRMDPLFLELEKCQMEAEKYRRGIWRYGDVFEEDF